MGLELIIPWWTFEKSLKSRHTSALKRNLHDWPLLILV
jgi:hypothetical protein